MILKWFKWIKNRLKMINIPFSWVGIFWRMLRCPSINVLGKFSRKWLHTHIYLQGSSPKNMLSDCTSAWLDILACIRHHRKSCDRPIYILYTHKRIFKQLLFIIIINNKPAIITLIINTRKQFSHTHFFFNKYLSQHDQAS